MSDQQSDPPSYKDVDELPRELRDALGEKQDASPRNLSRHWLRPSLGAALLLIIAGGFAYKVIIDYRHASPEAFFSVQDLNKLSQNKSVAATTAPIKIVPPDAPKKELESASSAAADAMFPAQDDSACASIKTEQHEIDAALTKQYSLEEGRFMQRRLRELTVQSLNGKCDEQRP